MSAEFKYVLDIMVNVRGKRLKKKEDKEVSLLLDYFKTSNMLVIMNYRFFTTSATWEAPKY